MKILSINSGSSSLKFKLYLMPQEQVLIYGYIEKIGSNSYWKIITEKTVEYEKPLKNFSEAVKVLINSLLEYKVIYSIDEIKAIGHRIVNGKDHYKSELVTEKVLEYLSSIEELSKVHMKGHIAGIKAFQKISPQIKQYVYYDTAFHHTIPKENYMYAVPYEWYTKYGVRKYGFHGISCEYITKEMEKLLNKKVNIIICHIGYGASVTLVENSKSIDNSMGFTANEGLIMGSRCGNIDHSILPYIHKRTKLTIQQIDDILNYQSGIEGYTKGSSDNRDLEKQIRKGNEKAILINEMYENKIVDYIAKYYIKLNHIDGIVFCAGVGENNPKFRKNIITKLHKLGLKINEKENKRITKFSKTPKGLITDKSSKIKCYVIPTDEELLIARKTYNIIKQVKNEYL